MSNVELQPGAAWMAVVRQNGSPEFADAFESGVEIAASVLPQTLVGVQAIGSVFGATSKMYESISFTHEAVQGKHTYLSWRARYRGADVSGATVLTTADSGKIASILLLHSPLDVVKSFSVELQERLTGV
ncbi:hypothetical protein [Paraburkholderia tropica]|uniref:hypothetical protein n=1 Tax=Paraburkholderia tropica TaxID=92647 RepID=UPI002ABE3B4A|nr:hypothetical protein [Paraburkholderia tropica]